MALLILGIVLFLGIHLTQAFVPDFRARMVARIGEGGWKGLYSLVSLVGLCLIIYGYGEARLTTGVLYTPPVFLRHIALLLMLISFVILAAGLLPAGHIATKTKHPQVLAVKIWAFAHLLANGETNSIVLFGAFLAWGVLVRISLKRRERAGERVLPAFRSARYDLFAVAIGVLAYLAFIWRLHEWLIGVQPIAMG